MPFKPFDVITLIDDDPDLIGVVLNEVDPATLDNDLPPSPMYYRIVWVQVPQGEELFSIGHENEDRMVLTDNKPLHELIKTILDGGKS